MKPTDLPDTRAQFETILLNRVKLMSTSAISREIWEAADLRTVFDWTLDQMMVQLQIEILAQKHARHSRIVEFTFPASPWQHAKKRLFPRLGGIGRWLLRTAPVVEVTKYVRIDYESQTMFPQAVMRFPRELGPQVHVMLDEVTRWEERDDRLAWGSKPGEPIPGEQDSPNDWPDP